MASPTTAVDGMTTLHTSPSTHFTHPALRAIDNALHCVFCKAFKLVRQTTSDDSSPQVSPMVRIPSCGCAFHSDCLWEASSNTINLRPKQHDQLDRLGAVWLKDARCPSSTCPMKRPSQAGKAQDGVLLIIDVGGQIIGKQWMKIRNTVNVGAVEAPSTLPGSKRSSSPTADKRGLASSDNEGNKRQRTVHNLTEERYQQVIVSGSPIKETSLVTGSEMDNAPEVFKSPRVALDLAAPTATAQTAPALSDGEPRLSEVDDDIDHVVPDDSDPEDNEAMMDNLVNASQALKSVQAITPEDGPQYEATLQPSTPSALPWGPLDEHGAPPMSQFDLMRSIQT